MTYFETKKKSDCCGCKLCGTICPREAISFINDEEGFWYPIINNDICIGCNLCKERCPLGSVKLDFIKDNKKAFAVYSKDDEVLQNSTSGGVFTHLSDFILDNGGVIFGHRYDNYMNCICSKAVSKTERNLFRGSKYVQSDMNSVYSNISEDVETGRLVLVTGTPCQIAAVKNSFENKIPENLFLMDIVCHGVPSPGIFAEYLKLLEKKYRNKIVNFEFRKKDNGWNSPLKRISFENGKTITENLNYDAFNYLFLIKDCILRPSCYNCKFAGKERISDISIADFWGIQDKHCEMFNENKGVSAVLVNSEKGKLLFEKIQSYVKTKNVPLVDIQKKNTPLRHPSVPYEKRTVFFKYYKENGLKKSINKFCQREIMKYKIKKNIKGILGQDFVTSVKGLLQGK